MIERLATSLLGLVVLACDGGGAEPADTKSQDTKPADTKLADTKLADTKAQDTKAAPEPPVGTVLLGGSFVHTCAEASACPELLQPAAAAHCKALTTGGLAWRLPERAEIAAWRGKPGLALAEGFHWSGTPFADDPGQVWIHDPATGTETTIPPDRKPFRARCVAKP